MDTGEPVKPWDISPRPHVCHSTPCALQGGILWPNNPRPRKRKSLERKRMSMRTDDVISFSFPSNSVAQMLDSFDPYKPNFFYFNFVNIFFLVKKKKKKKKKKKRGQRMGRTPPPAITHTIKLCSFKGWLRICSSFISVAVLKQTKSSTGEGRIYCLMLSGLHPSLREGRVRTWSSNHAECCLLAWVTCRFMVS